MKEVKKRLIKEEIIVDQLSGEILKEHHSTVTYDAEPAYIKLYIENLAKLHNLSSSKILFIMVRKMNYDSEVVLTPSIRKEIIEELNIKMPTLKAQIHQLIEEGVMMRKDNNRFLMNPNIFARGTWKDIKKIITTITYDQKGRMITTKFERDDHQLSLSFEQDK
jgi:hypothetical protein